MPAPASLPLRTDRLVLRPYEVRDVEPTLAYYADPEVSRYLLSEPFTPEAAKEAVEKRLQRIHPTRSGESLALVVEHEGGVVGDVVLELLGEQCSMGEIGWCFNPAYAGRGFATETAAALLDLAFEHYEMHRVKADGRTQRGFGSPVRATGNDQGGAPPAGLVEQGRMDRHLRVCRSRPRVEDEPGIQWAAGAVSGRSPWRVS